jgi:hypothetical protein
MIDGDQFGSCNCAYSCPCQFGWPEPTTGDCQAIVTGHIDQGYYGDTRLDGLNWALLLKWPGPIPEGNGTQQAIVDERADDAQFDALNRILHGEDTDPGTTHFFVYNSTMSRVLDPVRAPIDFACDIEARTGRAASPGLFEVRGEPIVDEASGNEHRVRIDLPDGFEYRIAEIGRGYGKTSGELDIRTHNTYAQFNRLHLNQHGVVA